MLDLGTLRVIIDADDSKAQKKLTSTDKKLQEFGKRAAKFGAKAAAAGATAVATLAGFAAKAYADYEQLVGGMDTLFKDSSDTMQAYAQNAYKTAGLSANKYMEVATGFSASLIASLNGDTAKAAEVGNMAITDMADNANKMGTSIESIQNAYQGFAKQNYTMLDNLKLGYGGTKEEMQRLLKDAEKLTGKKFNLNNFADITEAIHAIQEEMGITGATAEEAASTIEGSFGMVQSSFSNLLVGLGDKDADVDALFDNFTESVVTFGSNLFPVVVTILENVGNTIIEGFKKIAEDPKPIIDKGFELIKMLARGLIRAVPAILEAIDAVINDLVTRLVEKAREFKEAGKELLHNVWQGFKEKWNELVNWVNEKVQWIKDAFKGAMDEAPEPKGGMAKDGFHRNGLRSVPYDGYRAVLHQGEMILTNAEAKRYKKDEGSATTATHITVNNYSPKALNEAESARQFKKAQRQLALGM